MTRLFWLALVAAPFFLLGCKEEVCVERATIAAVGGCNKWGLCGVTFEDGDHGTVKLPSPGQTICVRTEVKQ